MQYRFFYVRAYRFRVVFPIFPVGAAICRPPKCVAFSLINPHIVRTIITYYFLLLTYYFYLSKPQGQLEVRVALRLASFGVILGLRQK